MSEIIRKHSGARMSKVVVHGGLVYLCGQTSSGKAIDGVAEQTAEVLSRIDALLEEVGSDRTQILSALIHLKFIEDFAAMNKIWEQWLPAGAAPARTTVQAALAQPDLLVEVTIVAALK